MANSVARAALIAMLCLISFVAAESRALDSGEPRSRGVNDRRVDDTWTMRECDEHITECGVMDDVKVITKPVTTIRVTSSVTTTTTKELPHITNIVTKVEVVTVNSEIQGHCRNTTVYLDPKPAIVTEYVTVEHVKEIVSVLNTTTTHTSTVTGKAIEQCFINTSGRLIETQRPAPTAAADPAATPQPNSPAVGVVEDSERETSAEHANHERLLDHIPDDISQDSRGNLFRHRDEL